MEQGRGGSVPDWDAVVFTEETTDRLRMGLRDLEQRIWVSLVAAVVVILFLISESGTAGLNTRQLRSTAAILAGVPLGLMVYVFLVHKDAVANVPPGWKPPSHSRSLSVSYAVVIELSILLALLSTDFVSANVAIYWLWNIVPLISLLFFAPSGFLAITTSYFGWPRDYPSRRITPERRRRILPAITVFFGLLFVKYFIGGIAGILSDPPDWIPLGKIIGGGIALYIFVFWLGSLSSTKLLLDRKLGYLETLHYRVVSLGMDRVKTLSEYGWILHAIREANDLPILKREEPSPSEAALKSQENR